MLSDKKMKIAFVVNRFPKLSEPFILNQITGLIDRGHEVEIFSKRSTKEEKMHSDIKKYNLLKKTNYFGPKNLKEEAILGIISYFSGLKQSPLEFYKIKKTIIVGQQIILSKKLFQKIKETGKEFDIIHAHFGPNGKLISDSKYFKKNKTKLITSFYGYDASSLLEQNPKMYEILFSQSKRIIVLSEYMKRKLIAVGCPPKKIVKIPLSINTKKFKSKKIKPKNKKPIILTVARFVEKKGIEFTIEALSKIKKEYEYHLIGGGPLKEKIEQKVLDKGIKDKVFFHGWCKDKEVIKQMQKSDIFLLHSITASDGDQEGTPTVLLEAQAAELPVVSTYHAGIPEIVKDGQTGLLANEKDVKKLTELLKILIENERKRKQMGKKGRKFMEKNHSISKVSLKLTKIYSSFVLK